MKFWKATLMPLTAIAMAACGGGTQVAGIDAGGAPRVAVVAKGTLTGFGSVIVNGVRYDTDSATFGIDGGGGTLTDLRIGQIITVTGTLDSDGINGIADRVTFQDNVQGPVELVDVADSTLRILGQNVIVNGDTAFDASVTPASVAGLSVGTIVEVSGFVRADGGVNATRIETKPAGGEFEVLGIVADLARGAGTFKINDLVVDFSAAQLDDFPGGEPQNGQLVEAKGTTLSANGELLATRVEFEGDDIPGEEGDEIELEGFITRFADSGDFDIEGRAVTTDGQTAYEDGNAGNLAANVKVEVEGRLNASGVIVAEKIKFKQSSNVRVEGTVQSIDADENTLAVLGIAINVTDSTRLEDKSDLRLERLTLEEINVDDFVAVRGFVDNGELTATRLERDDDENEVALRAVVETVNEPRFTLFGVSVQTDAGTEFEAEDDGNLTAAEFFGQALGRLVEVEGTLNGTIIEAEEVSLED